MNRECRTCEFRVEGLSAGEPFECRRYPPVIVPFTHGRPTTEWPEVRAYQWCGEWKHDGIKR